MNMDQPTLALIWFFLLGILLAGYAILDGFDLGVGMLHNIVAKTDEQRRLAMNSIGPLWDGNEVWLITFGGAMFAMFPEVYSTIFSGFYLALMLLLVMLISRAVSMEFRSKLHTQFWRTFWDRMFTLGSTVATLLFGVAVGNVIRGVPLTPDYEFAGNFLTLLNPYSIAVGLLAVALFAMHGSIYLYLKTEGELQQRLVPWMWRTFFLFLVLFVIVSAWTLASIPNATATLKAYPWAWAVPVLNVLAIANIPRAIHKGLPGYAFISSSCSILAFVFLFMVALFPNLVPAINDPSYSLTIYNSSSSITTMKIGLLIAIIGMPCVLAYTSVIYWTFRGKVTLSDTSY